jgi:phosphate transport system substrate-binding protein
MRFYSIAPSLSLLALLACGGERVAPSASDSAASPAPPAAAATTPAPEGSSLSLDPGLPSYQPTGGISGSLSSVGSDTLNNLMTLWAEGFQRAYPNVRVQIEGKGSSTAPPALISGTAQLGPMSRAMKSSEVEEFERRYGYQPTQVRVAVDALAVYVHRDNPLAELSLPAVDAIFSKTRVCGAARPIDTWGDAGSSGDWTARPISLYGRNSASGTYGFFKDHALCGGDYRDQVKEQPGSASVVQGVSEDRNGIGYSGIGYRTSGVKPLALARDEGGTAHGVDPQAVYSGEYPLSRYLYVYVNKAPNRPLDPLVRELMRYLLSREGQEVVIKDGYLPLTEELASAERAKLE